MSIILSLGGVYYNEFVEPLQLNEPPDVQMKQFWTPGLWLFSLDFPPEIWQAAF